MASSRKKQIPAMEGVTLRIMNDSVSTLRVEGRAEGQEQQRTGRSKPRDPPPKGLVSIDGAKVLSVNCNTSEQEQRALREPPQREQPCGMAIISVQEFVEDLKDTSWAIKSEENSMTSDEDSWADSNASIEPERKYAMTKTAVALSGDSPFLPKRSGRHTIAKHSANFAPTLANLFIVA